MSLLLCDNRDLSLNADEDWAELEVVCTSGFDISSLLPVREFCVKVCRASEEIQILITRRRASKQVTLSRTCQHHHESRRWFWDFNCCVDNSPKACKADIRAQRIPKQITETFGAGAGAEEDYWPFLKMVFTQHDA